MTGRPSGDRGSATVWVIALSAVLAVVGTAVVLVGAATVARHRAEAAADLAALAAAGRVAGGEPDACGLAAEVARANAARLASCAVGADAVVELRVSVPVRLGRLGVWAASARARAGPVPVGWPASAYRPPRGRLEDEVLLVSFPLDRGLRSRSELVEDDVEHTDRAGLVQGVVAVAALR
jgi:secretion/DNA translocation related TadE-like protein